MGARHPRQGRPWAESLLDPKGNNAGWVPERGGRPEDRARGVRGHSGVKNTMGAKNMMGVKNTENTIFLQNTSKPTWGIE